MFETILYPLSGRQTTGGDNERSQGESAAGGWPALAAMTACAAPTPPSRQAEEEPVSQRTFDQVTEGLPATLASLQPKRCG
jgi:hypothetical protein